MFCDYSMLVLHVVRIIDQVSLRLQLFGTKGFHVKAENKRFTVWDSRCRQILKY